MKKIVGVIVLFLNTSITFSQEQNLKLWYKAPADASVKDVDNGWKNDEEWLKALPVGNGFLGAMVFGDVNKERLQLNDKTLWSGSVADNDNPDAFASLQEIRNLLFAGKYKEATELTNKTQVCKGAGSGNGNGSTVPFGCFQTLGDLWIDFKAKGSYKNYYRDLDIINGISSVQYEQHGTQFRREVFASFPAKALIVHLTASTAKALSFTLDINRPERYAVTTQQNSLVMRGTMSNGTGGEGMQYKVSVTPLLKGGKLSATGNKLEVSDADEVTIVITAGTNYRLHYPDYNNANYEAELDRVTAGAVRKSYAVLRREHVQDFSSFMKRVTLQLGDKGNADLPTDELLQK
ncbi:MAG TPA: glycoside hydrolase family 95 protein, partial [Agriterribacter sp.]|nr:glycoside hydrolase family 95 protein [Agriterribacter sp.]